MKSLKDQLKTVSKNLVALSKQVDKLSVQVEKATKKAAAKPAAKKPVRRKPARKPAAKKAPVRTRKAAPARARKAAPAARKAAGGSTVLDSVYNVIKRSKKGVAISTLKTKTKLDPRQLSNALYKLTKKGAIKAVSRGVYAKA